MPALPTSLRPDGLLQGLSDQEIRDFLAYLRIPQPITRSIRVIPGFLDCPRLHAHWFMILPADKISEHWNRIR